MRFTSKQREILAAIKAGNRDGEPCTVYDLAELVPYECSRSAMAHSIKILITNGYAEKLGRVRRPDGTHMTYGLTAAGLTIV